MPVLEAHDAQLYTLGSGILYIDAWSGATPPSFPPSTDVGNCPDFSLEPTKEVLEHFSSRSGAKTLDKEATLRKGFTATITLDEFSVNNLKMFMMATLTTIKGGAQRLDILQASDVEYAVYFLSDNEEGPDYKVFLPRCKLSPNGALGFISDDWNTMIMTAKGLADETNSPDYPLGYVEFVTTTTTTTTTTP